MVRKYQNQRSKVRAGPDVKSLQVTIPKEIALGARVQEGNHLEWILVKEGLNEYVMVVKARD